MDPEYILEHIAYIEDLVELAGNKEIDCESTSFGMTWEEHVHVLVEAFFRGWIAYVDLANDDEKRQLVDWKTTPTGNRALAAWRRRKANSV